MAKKYVALFGKQGTKDFRKVKRARAFAQSKANKTGKTVEIDRVTTYPKARPGQTDFSQRHHAYVKPKRRR